MNPLLMDAVVAARQAELRRSARRSLSTRPGSRVRAIVRSAGEHLGAGRLHRGDA